MFIFYVLNFCHFIIRYCFEFRYSYFRFYFHLLFITLVPFVSVPWPAMPWKASSHATQYQVRYPEPQQSLLRSSCQRTSAPLPGTYVHRPRQTIEALRLFIQDQDRVLLKLFQILSAKHAPLPRCVLGIVSNGHGLPGYAASAWLI